MLTKDKILEILNDWNFWHKDITPGISREKYQEKLLTHYNIGLAVSLIGLRRSGKSTIMQMLADELRREKNIATNNFLYVNFEDSRFLGEYSIELLENIYEVYQQIVKPVGKPIVLLDEVQNIVGWEKFVNSLIERERASVFVSGSNSYLLSSELSSVLTGRQTVVKVFPLSFKEFLLFNKININGELDIVNKKLEIKELFNVYLKFGGMPKPALVATEDEKNIILRNYFEDIINRDIIVRFKIRQTDKLKTLAKFYLTNISSLISYNKVKDFLKIPLSTIERFSDYFTTPFLLYFVPKFSYSLKEQSVNPRKVYAADLGLRNAISFNSSEDRGKLLENLIFLQLLRSEDEIYYYKTKDNLEVDFLIRQKGKIKYLIQVCVSLKNFNTREREIKALLNAMKELNLSEALIITEDEEEVIEDDGKKIIAIPAYWWLLK